MRRFGFIAALLGFSALSAKPKGKCPVCGSEGETLGLVAVALEGFYSGSVGWVQGLRLRWCPSCGTLFAVKDAEGTKR